MECYDGTVIVVKNCNCGYGGVGPNNTVDLLRLLGIEKAEAEKYVFQNSAVELYFDEDNQIIQERTNLANTFESRESPCSFGKIDLHTIDYFSSEERTMYLIDPNGATIYALVQMLQVMEPMSLSYYVGQDNSKYIDLPDLPARTLTKHRRRAPPSRYSFALIKGFYFDVVCLFKLEVAKTVINNIAMLLELSPPFHEVALWGLTFLTKESLGSSRWDKLLAMLKQLKSEPEIYVQQSVEQKKRRRPSLLS